MYLPVSLVSCKDKIIKIELSKDNPVEYTFNTPKDSLYKIISTQLSINNMMIWDAIHKDMVIEEISNLFSYTKNKSDFCLMPIDYLSKSKIYLKENGDSLEYEAWFYLHLEAVDKMHTKVSIKTIEPKIIIGRELIPKPPHFVRRDKTIPVEPSTIEEYQILLKIGKLLKEQNMPSLILPDANCLKKYF